MTADTCPGCVCVSVSAEASESREAGGGRLGKGAEQSFFSRPLGARGAAGNRSWESFFSRPLGARGCPRARSRSSFFCLSSTTEFEACSQAPAWTVVRARRSLPWSVLFPWSCRAKASSAWLQRRPGLRGRGLRAVSAWMQRQAHRAGPWCLSSAATLATASSAWLQRRGVGVIWGPASRRPGRSGRRLAGRRGQRGEVRWLL